MTGDELEYYQSEDAEWADWISEESEECDCLFCATKLTNITAAFEHMKTDHKFDIIKMKTDWSTYKKIVI